MKRWKDRLNGDPLPWLLETKAPAVRAGALRALLDLPIDDGEVVLARSQAMTSDPIASILGAMDPQGYWVEPGPGYGGKYRGTVWEVVFLDQLGADGDDPRIRKACEYVLAHTQTASGGFGASYDPKASQPPPASALHCMNGNLLRALIGFGQLENERVRRGIDWQARSITGEDFGRYYRSGTTGPTFCCSANDKLPCAWGAVKATLALARIPAEKREGHVHRALQQATDFLLSRDPAVADYPFSARARKPSQSWFKLGFPSGYVTDVLQNLEAICEAGHAGDPRLEPAIAWLLSKQDLQGRWKNEYAYNGKTWIDFEKQGNPSKWVTLRACKVLNMVSEA